MHPVQRPCTANNASQFSTVAKNDAVPNPTPQALGGHELYTARRMLNTAYRTQRYGVAGAPHAPCSAPGRNYKPALKNSCARPGVNHFFVAPSGNLAQTARQPHAKYAHDRAHQRRQLLRGAAVTALTQIRRSILILAALVPGALRYALIVIDWLVAKARKLGGLLFSLAPLVGSIMRILGVWLARSLRKVAAWGNKEVVDARPRTRIL